MPRATRSGIRVLSSKPRWNKASSQEKVEAYTAYGKELFREDDRPRNARGLLKEFLRRVNEQGEWERQCRDCGDYLPECDEFFELHPRHSWICRDCQHERNRPARERRPGYPASRHAASSNRRAAKSNAIGKLSKADIEEKWIIQSGRCYWCAAPLHREGERWSPAGRFHVDHYVPLSKGGSNKKDNIVLSCPGCNLRKATKAPEKFEELRRKQLGATLSVSSQE